MLPENLANEIISASIAALPLENVFIDQSDQQIVLQSGNALAKLNFAFLFHRLITKQLQGKK